MKVQPNSQVLKESGYVSAASNIDAIRNFSNLPPVEQRVQAALYMGYFDNLVQLYNNPNTSADVKAQIRTVILDPVGGIANFQRAVIGTGSALDDAYTNAVQAIITYPSPTQFAQAMKICGTYEATDRSAAFAFLNSSECSNFSFANAQSGDTLALYAQFLASLNNNPIDTPSGGDTAYLQKWLGQGAGVHCYDVMADYCYSYMKSARPSNLFPVSSSDPTGLNFFFSTLSSVTDKSCSAYSGFINTLQSRIVAGQPPIKTPSDIAQDLNTFGWLPTFGPPPADSEQLGFDIEFMDLISRESADFDPSEVGVCPQSCSLRI